MYVSLALQFAYICAHEIYDFKRFCFLLEERDEVGKNTAFYDGLKQFFIELGGIHKLCNAMSLSLRFSTKKVCIK